MPVANEIINKENLSKSVTQSLLNLRSNLVSKGYSEEDAGKAIAGALPYCISYYVFNYVQIVK